MDVHQRLTSMPASGSWPRGGQPRTPVEQEPDAQRQDDQDEDIPGHRLSLVGTKRPPNLAGSGLESADQLIGQLRTLGLAQLERGAGGAARRRQRVDEGELAVAIRSA